jgi:hypothetical protein
MDHAEQYENCKELWAKHLALLIEDATLDLEKIYCPSQNDKNHVKLMRRRARMYIFSSGTMFEWACEAVGVSSSIIRTAVLRKIAKREHRSKAEICTPSAQRSRTYRVQRKGGNASVARQAQRRDTLIRGKGHDSGAGANVAPGANLGHFQSTATYGLRNYAETQGML